ncbi:hypothetical protein L3X38_015316 [Prunus dulcis]|uniref:Uncharacterized protein n=1 Tax=Prunus dulcis TaxID=3755 RepID=A0AAD4ZHX2_PRUDU|nr:hypothetical protein L3X38_015316 [Prunus dulcis]
MHITKYEVLYLDFADRPVTYPKGIIEDVLIRLKQFVFPADFFILDMVEDHDFPLLLGWPFLTVAGTLKDVQQGTLTLRVQGKSIEFKVFEAVKKLRDLEEYDRIDLLDPIVHVNYLENTSSDILKAKSSPPLVMKRCALLLAMPEFINVSSKASPR